VHSLVKNLIFAGALSVGALLAMGCKGDASKPAADLTATTGSAQAGTSHAPANVAPGSHEDWCGEHEVPESLCTRCNGALVAAFKATGDWCAEHGLPESQCKVCNPSLKIERPPKK
jgi:hypothetical protein